MEAQRAEEESLPLLSLPLGSLPLRSLPPLSPSSWEPSPGPAQSVSRRVTALGLSAGFYWGPPTFPCTPRCAPAPPASLLLQGMGLGGLEPAWPWGEGGWGCPCPTAGTVQPGQEVFLGGLWALRPPFFPPGTCLVPLGGRWIPSSFGVCCPQPPTPRCPPGCPCPPA